MSDENDGNQKKLNNFLLELNNFKPKRTDTDSAKAIDGNLVKSLTSSNYSEKRQLELEDVMCSNSCFLRKTT